MLGISRKDTITVVFVFAIVAFFLWFLSVRRKKELIDVKQKNKFQRPLELYFKKSEKTNQESQKLAKIETNIQTRILSLLICAPIIYLLLINVVTNKLRVTGIILRILIILVMIGYLYIIFASKIILYTDKILINQNFRKYTISFNQIKSLKPIYIKQEDDYLQGLKNKSKSNISISYLLVLNNNEEIELDFDKYDFDAFIKFMSAFDKIDKSYVQSIRLGKLKF